MRLFDLIGAYERHVSDLLSRVAVLERENTKLQRQALTDPLTGLANRRAFHAEMEARLARLDRARGDGSGHFALVLIDLDRFKAINDSLGHSAGDEQLIAVADALRRVVRKNDMAARVGGDEFAMLCDLNGDPKGPEALGRRIRDSIKAHSKLTASVGVAEVRTTTSATLALDTADACAYAGKAGGGDAVGIARTPTPSRRRSGSSGSTCT